jgi:hypothetical protein
VCDASPKLERTCPGWPVPASADPNGGWNNA